VLFLFAGAPDVAFTQVVVETVFVIVVAAVLLALKRQGKAMSVSEPGWRPMALVLSLAFATVLTALLLAAVALPFDDTLSRWFGEHSVPAAQGRNVVNVILVDFRALDTLGEITVVMLSLLAAVPLLRAVRTRRDTEAGR
jgi:multicomponent Na+:H+ antiporter subunit A